MKITDEKQNALNKSLLLSCTNKNIPSMTSLLLKGAIPSDDVLSIASKHNSTEIMDILISNGLSQKKLNKLLEYSITKSKKLQFVKFCIEKGADVNSVEVYGQYALEFAIFDYQKEIVFYLIDQNIDFTKNKSSPLVLAGSIDDISILKRMIEKGANITNFVKEMLEECCRNKSFNMIKYLIIEHNQSEHLDIIINYKEPIGEIRDWAINYKNKKDFNNKLEKDLQKKNASVNKSKI